MSTDTTPQQARERLKTTLNWRPRSGTAITTVLFVVVGSAWAWLGPRLGVSWSDRADAAEQLDDLLDHLTGRVLLAFRAATGRAVLDKPTATVPPAASAATPSGSR